jgi:hypothetical protein
VVDQGGYVSTTGCNRPPASRAAAEPAVRYPDTPAAVGPMRPRSIHGSLRLSARSRWADTKDFVTPPGNQVRSNFQPSSVGRITGACSRPPSSAAETPVRYPDIPAAVDLLRPRSIHGSLKLRARYRHGRLMHRVTPPANGIRSDFQPPFVARITSGWSRPPSSAAQPPIRYTDSPAAVDLLRPRAIHGSLKLEGRFRKGELMHRITPPATNVSSNFQPPFVARITSGWSRPPSSAAQPPIRYADGSNMRTSPLIAIPKIPSTRSVGAIFSKRSPARSYG